MAHCPVTHDLNRHLNSLSVKEARGDAIRDKFLELTADHNKLAEKIDNVLSGYYTDVGLNGNTNLANELATVLQAGIWSDALQTLIRNIQHQAHAALLSDAEDAIQAEIDEADEASRHDL